MAVAKGGFLTPLDLEDIDGTHWRTLTPLIYLSAAKAYFVVPKGFETDLASIPRGLWNILPKTGLWDKAGCLHDWIYRHPGKLSRQQCDDLLREACRACGVGVIYRNLIYLGVRLGGWDPWNIYRKGGV